MKYLFLLCIFFIAENILAQTQNNGLDEIDFFRLYSDEVQVDDHYDPDMITIVQNVTTDWGKMALKGYVKTLRQEVKYTDRTHTRLFSFNTAGKLVKYEEYDSRQKLPKRSIEYQYNANNQLIKVSDKKNGRLQTRNIQYTANKLTGATYQSNGLVAKYGRNGYIFTYNAKGQIIKFENQNNKSESPRSYTYNTQGKCIKESYDRNMTLNSASKKGDKISALMHHINKLRYNNNGDLTEIDRSESHSGGNVKMITPYQDTYNSHKYDDYGNWITETGKSRQIEYYTQKELGDIVDTSTGKSGASNKDNTIEIIINKIKKTQVIIWSGGASRSFSYGEGSVKMPYLISTPEELAYLAKLVNEGNKFEGKYFMLVNDLDLGASKEIKLTWDPIGNKQETPFGGIFLGSGKTIYNMETNKGLGQNLGTGLFGVLSRSAVVSAVNIDKTCRVDGTNAGAIAGINKGVIHGCNSAATIEGSDIGGISGLNEGSIVDCSSSSYIYIPLYVAGGISAKNSGLIKRCSFTGKILFVMTTGYCGGITGEVLPGGRIADCYSTGNISANTFSVRTKAGGITGTKEFKEAGEVIIKNCYSAVTGKGSHILPDYKKNIQHLFNCFFDIDIKELSKSEKKEIVWYTEHGGKKTDEMKTDEFVRQLNENKDGPWLKDIKGVNMGYPVLKFISLSTGIDNNKTDKAGAGKTDTIKTNTKQTSVIIFNPESPTGRFPMRTDTGNKSVSTSGETKITEEEKPNEVLPLNTVIKVSSFPKEIKFKELSDLGYWKILSIKCVGRTTRAYHKGYRFIIKVIGLKDSRKLSPSSCSLDIAHATKGSFNIKKELIGSYNFPKLQEGEVAEFEIANLFDDYPNPEFAGFLVFRTFMSDDILKPYDTRWKIVD